MWEILPAVAARDACAVAGAKTPAAMASELRSGGICAGQRADEGTRTPNPLFTRQVRYRLRHAGQDHGRAAGPGLMLPLPAPSPAHERVPIR